LRNCVTGYAVEEALVRGPVLRAVREDAAGSDQASQKLDTPMEKDHGPRKSQGPREDAGRRGRRSLTVLVVDADAQRAQLLAEWLQPLGQVAIAPTARIAASVFAQRIPDLVITDLDLPDAAGVDFVALLARAPATRHILRMVVTRRRAVRDKIAALRAGADEYVIWPCDRDFLIQRVKLLSRFRRSLS
jgi:CheY-like chemotaxis protein